MLHSAAVREQRGNVTGSMVKGSGQHLSQSGSRDVNVPIQLKKEGMVGCETVVRLYLCIFVLLLCITSVRQ